MYLIITIIILIIVLICLKTFNVEKFINYRNAVFLSRPPYSWSYNYIPYRTIFPAYIYKNNFLPHPMEGFQNIKEPFLGNILNSGAHKGIGDLESGLPKLVDGYKPPKIRKLQSQLQSQQPQSQLQSQPQSQLQSQPQSQLQSHPQSQLQPQFDSKLKATLDKRYQALTNLLKKMEQKELPNKKMQPSQPAMPVKKGYQKNMQSLRFFSTDKCVPEYPNYTGAYFSITSENDSEFSCNGEDNIDTTRAKAIATIANGRLNRIILIDGGKGYQKIPAIKIIGKNGSHGARARAITDDDGKVNYIDVLSAGNNFEDTPNIIVEHPNVGKSCYLCSK